MSNSYILESFTFLNGDVAFSPRNVHSYIKMSRYIVMSLSYIKMSRSYKELSYF